jgi:hypothetical protein
VRRPKRWRPLFFDILRQCSHSLRGSRGRRASWPATFSLRRPPIRTEMGVREIAGWRTFPRRSGNNKSAAWRAWRSLEAILIKAKNTKSPNSICFFKLQFSGNYQDTPRILYLFETWYYRVLWPTEWEHFTCARTIHCHASNDIFYIYLILTQHTLLTCMLSLPIYLPWE